MRVRNPNLLSAAHHEEVATAGIGSVKAKAPELLYQLRQEMPLSIPHQLALVKLHAKPRDGLTIPNFQEQPVL